MKYKMVCRIFGLFFLCGMMINLVACHGEDKSDKDKTDSATTKNVIAKKRGKTSGTYLASNNGKIVKDAHGIYNFAEVAPQFPGGQDALSNYINNNITYPQSAIDSGISGTIHVGFIVDEKGKVTNPEVLDKKHLNEGLNEETLNMFKNMPLWTPGLVKGKKVKTRLELPVTFHLEDAQ